MKRAMATNGNNMGNGYGEDDGMVARGHGLCVCFGVCGETTKNKEENKIVNVSLSFKKPPTGYLP
jgi:hypothetical protein